ncbi:MAG: hypothetical protein II875_00035 [Clostridia bacterium]|nr:hypothetical protein [Clostridia bacterium]
MSQEKPYAITSIKRVSGSKGTALEIWLKLNDDSKHTKCTLRGVTIDNMDSGVSGLRFPGGSSEVIRWIGGTKRPKEYCFAIDVDNSTFQKLKGSHSVRFDIIIDNVRYSEDRHIDNI